MHSIRQAVRCNIAANPQTTGMTTTICRPKASRRETAVRLSNILVPVDFSHASRQALLSAGSLAHSFGAHLTLVYVVPGVTSRFPDYPALPKSSPTELRDAEKRLSGLANEQSVLGLKCDCALRIGLAGHEIVEAARELDADLIVIATHGYTGWKHLCLGSTAERVVRAAPCPVFVVRDKKDELT
jgi:universal stress protein A